MSKVIRSEYRACLREDIREEAFQLACRETASQLRHEIQAGRVLTASVYRHRSMCFLYCEWLEQAGKPEDLLPLLSSFLETWPEEDGLLFWAPMYPIYWHHLPESFQGEDAAFFWEQQRQERKRRVGRIAFLKPEKLFSYTYWHQAIVEEGLLKGDQYQFISLHENILFSYFEEPKHMVNIRGSEEGSEVTRKWLAVDPEGHFDREKAGGENFLILPAIISEGRNQV